MLYYRSFAVAVFLQSKYQNDHRIFAINGIPDTHMFGFETALHREFSLKILPTNLTDQKNPTLQPIGRWNILCTKSNVVELAKELHGYQAYSLSSTSQPVQHSPTALNQ
jgi:hypothetical protein